jgi:hypothetical protein
MRPLAGPIATTTTSHTPPIHTHSTPTTPTKDKRISRRLSARQLAAIDQQLTSRDRETLKLVSRFRVMSGRQLAELLWSNVAPSARARVARRGLARLVALDVLQPLARRVGGERAGSASTTFALGRTGQYLARGSTARRVRAAYTPGVRYLAHTLAVAQLYVDLATHEAELLSFDPEPECWRPYMVSFGARQILKPDAYLVLATSSHEYAWLIEQDMATEALTTIAAKAARYHEYFSSGVEQTERGLFPRVLWIVPSAERATAILETLATLPSEAGSLFEVATAADAVTFLTTEAQA